MEQNKAVIMWTLREQAEPDMESDHEEELYVRCVLFGASKREAWKRRLASEGSCQS
jgi:hypothetical protein